MNNNHLNVSAASLNIGPLAANGAINQTHALLPGSIAIEAGNNAYVVAPPFDNVSPITDERGTGFPRQVGAAVDIGSFEANYAITATAGTGQSTIVGSAFVTNLAATVTESGNPVSGVSVTFTAPGSGASGTFANSTNTETVTTNASGIATASQFTANAIQGNYNVVATATGVPGSASFNLTNIIGPATHFSVSAPASATAGSAFSFTVTALDQFNNTTTGYAGTVHFTSSDGSAVLPANSTLTNGAGTFSATLKTAWQSDHNCDRYGDKFHHGDQRHDCGKCRIGDAFHGQRTGFCDGRFSFQFYSDGLDQFNNTVTSYTGTVHFTSSDGNAVLPANSTLTNGAGTFSATLNTGGNQTITATDTVNSSITGSSNTIVVGNQPCRCWCWMLRLPNLRQAPRRCFLRSTSLRPPLKR